MPRTQNSPPPGLTTSHSLYKWRNGKGGDTCGETGPASLGSLGSVRDFGEKLTIPGLHLHRAGLGLDAELPREKGTRTLPPYPSLTSLLRHTPLEGKGDPTGS